VAEPAYIDSLRSLTTADIETAFRKPRGWFGRDRVRKRLYARGFPHPSEACDGFPLFVLTVDHTGGALKL
jgi:hypothetical protein